MLLRSWRVMGKRRAQTYSKSRMEKCSRGSTDQTDRRNFIPTVQHPGSYAVTHAEEMAKLNVTRSVASKRKFAFLIGYQGTDFTGMQMNPGVKTIEAELERAMFLSGGIDASNFGVTQKISWSRAGRTDKGVHAIGQVIGAKVHVEKESSFIEQMNSYLPETIRVLQCVRATKPFNAKVSCQRRTYEYVAPTFLFAPKATCLDSDEKLQSFRLGSDSLEKLNQALQQYCGTHNFNNFTSKLAPTDPKCQRYILSFEASTPFETKENGMEWIQLRVEGQSFLLHHIRKMIALAVEVVRGQVDLELISKTLNQEKYELPIAPGEGLYLAKGHFDDYNKRVQGLHPLLTFDDPESLARIEKMRESIRNHIFENETKSHAFRNWLQGLNESNLSYQGRPYDEWKQFKQEQSAAATKSDVY